jgi:hypothetical protein
MSSSLLSKKTKIKIFKAVISLVVLNGCETCSVTLRKGLRLREFENRVLRRIFGPKREEVEEGWIDLHNEELRNFHSATTITRKSRKMKYASHVARME